MSRQRVSLFVANWAIQPNGGSEKCYVSRFSASLGGRWGEVRDMGEKRKKTFMTCESDGTSGGARNLRVNPGTKEKSLF